MPQLSIDCVIFSYHEGKLKVLVLKILHHELRCLPSGFIFKDEDIDQAALRNLKERTGLEELFLQQFHTFGKAKRYFPDQVQSIVDSLGIGPEHAQWFFQRFVTVGYYSLVRLEEVEPKVDLFTDGFDWVDVAALPPLIMDHPEMILKAKTFLKGALHTQPVALQLLPPSFTLPELQRLYEIILDRSIDRRNFRKKILATKTLIPLDQQRKTAGHRAPNLYQFDKEVYLNSLGEKSKLGF